MPCPEKFRDSLVEFAIPTAVISEIDDGFEKLISKSPKKLKAAYFKRAVDILDAKIDDKTVRSLLEWNACCKSGARDRASKEFARINAGLPIEEKLKKIAKAPYMNMGSPELVDGANGSKDLLIHAVSYVYEGAYACGCSNFNRVKRDYSVSKKYCYCCSGHFKYHYQIMLDAELTLKEVVSSPLDSNGKNPCVFLFSFN